MVFYFTQDGSLNVFGSQLCHDFDFWMWNTVRFISEILMTASSCSERTKEEGTDNSVKPR